MLASATTAALAAVGFTLLLRTFLSSVVQAEGRAGRAAGWLKSHKPVSCNVCMSGWASLPCIFEAMSASPRDGAVTWLCAIGIGSIVLRVYGRLKPEVVESVDIPPMEVNNNDA